MWLQSLQPDEMTDVLEPIIVPLSRILWGQFAPVHQRFKEVRRGDCAELTCGVADRAGDVGIR